jgi:hypothetical protein
MADKNVKLKVRVTGTDAWNQLYPETKVDLIVDASDAGKSVLNISTPSVDSYMKITNVAGNPVASTLDKAQVRADIGAAAATHYHKIGDVNIPDPGYAKAPNSTLTQALDLKADLVGGVIPASQLPSFVTGGLRYEGTVTTSINISTTIVPTLGTTVEHRGKYWVATNNTTLNFSTNVNILAPGDEGETTTGMVIEPGDWLVFIDYSGSKYNFAIINNTYASAGVGVTGVVSLSANEPTTRGALSGVASSSTVVHEKLLKGVLKEIWYENTEPGAAMVGDILFQGAGD